MSLTLSKAQVRSSFEAVGDFLWYIGCRTDDRFETKCLISVNHPKNFTWDIEFEQNGYGASYDSYIIRSNVFKSKGYYRPVWSAYHHFKWNDVNKELNVTIDNNNYKFSK